ncbi:GGDEF domain-containing protein [Sphingomonas sabuli]|uniref:diguanylate cyclase n=1 Tax=Sphingomonas sabuli TaxID=2764186 RepID=A0A7G9L4I4_9SPHN|nr:GGDEF domain-containing protein [Sphingomonas sabuli]QNM83533.1 GGDEF domain-containing protein [Sphingomonas sabuli]
MGGTVSILAVQTALFACLAAGCIAVYFGFRRESALGWLAAALSFGFVQMLAYQAWPSDRLEIASGFLLAAPAFYCNAQCLRRLYDLPGPNRALWGAALFTGAAGLVTLGLGASLIAVMALFQLTMVLGLADCLRILIAARDAHWLRLVLLGGFAGLGLIFVVRVPSWLLLLPAGTGYADARHSMLDTTLLSVGALLTCIITAAFIAQVVGKHIGLLRNRSSRDGLTGLLNRRSFIDAASRTARRPGAIVYCDIDHFKQVNDRFGHGVGDRVIQELARLLDDSGFVAGRLGGEEFALLMPSVPALRANQLMEDLREAFSNLRIDGVDPRHRLTASFGIATFDSGHRPTEYLDQADRALYLAKNNGRDQVVMLRSDSGPTLARMPLAATA